MQSNESSYRSIFKSTFLFGFVQVFNIVMKAAINKAVAILLGTDGMGVISLYEFSGQYVKDSSWFRNSPECSEGCC